MEKDLLNISGEDDWLLKNTPKKGVKSFSGGNSGKGKSYFDSSPLQIPKSIRNVSPRPPFSPIGRVNNKNMEQASQSNETGTVGKENTSGSKVELPKLSVERQQMKKKKKNAGFNLRKSLAWDRAFSTEEGVLDPVELSKIAGGDILPVIHEDYSESISASKCSSVSPGLRALEENLFNDLPSSSKRREKKIVIGTVPKYTTPSKAKSSLVEKQAKTLSSGSKRSGCPRPPPSSSLKRPANIYSTPPHSKELGIPKVSSTKFDPATVANNMKRIVQSPSKPKISQPTLSKNSQRSLGSVSFSKSYSSTYSKPKSSLASKSSIPKPSLNQARRNVINKTLDVPSISSSQHSVVGKSNDGPMATSDVDMLGHGSNVPDSALAQSSYSRVGNTQGTVSRLGKPSGLRMPSPSIGYFSKSDSQPSHSAEDTHSQLLTSAPHSSLIPTFKKPQFVERVNSKSAHGNNGGSGSATGLSIVPKPSQERVKVDLKRRSREIESKVSSCSSSSQTKDTGKVVLDDVVVCRPEKTSAAKCEDSEGNSELPPSGCKNNGQDGNIDTFYVNGQPLNEEEITQFLSGEKAVVSVNHSTENVAKQPEALDSFTAGPDSPRDFASRNSDVDDLSSVEAPDCVQSSCDHLEENAMSSFHLYGHSMVCDGEAVLEPKRIEVSNASTKTNCEADSTGSPDIEQNMEEMKLPLTSSAEAKREDKPVESSHEPVSEKLASDCSNVSDGCCPAKDVSADVFSCSDEELEDNSELEDMDMVTESDCSDEELEANLKLKEVGMVSESELISNHKGALNQEYPKVKAIPTASDPCGKTKSLLSESIGSPASIFVDPESPNDQEAGSNEEEKVQVIRISPDSVASVSREEELRTLIPKNEASSASDDVLRDDTLTPQSNGSHASENSENICTCSSEGNVKAIQMGAKLEKKPDPIIVKPWHAAPFSDEWLAAIEAAGEEILTLKSGRVQHSPTEKVAPELGPWSPVKKKNNQVVGPFDCTKYTNKGLPPALD